MLGKVVVAGASGFVGAAAVAALQTEGWQVVGLSRRRPAAPVAGVDYVGLDLRDADACHAFATDHPDATHLIYAAVNETEGGLVAGWQDTQHAERNGTMFANLLSALAASPKGLSHVTAVHGAKAYATHRLPQSRIPLKESQPRPEVDDFYFRQEDILWDKARAHGFGWTTFRPALIVGGGEGSNLSSILALAVYALIRQAQGLPAPFPGAETPRGINQMTDVSLLAQALCWSLTAVGAKDKTFNITNGDVYAWEDMWPVLMAALGVEAAPPSPMSVQEYVRDHAAIWGDIVARAQLKTPADPIEFLGESFALADYTLPKAARSIVMSTIALQQAGFTQCIDSAESLQNWIAHWQSLRILPPARVT